MSRAFQASLPLARHGIDRDHASRTNPELLDRLWLDPAARVIVLHRGQALAASGANPGDWDGFGTAPATTVRAVVALARPAELPGSVTSALPSAGSRTAVTTDPDAAAEPASEPSTVRLYLGRVLPGEGTEESAPAGAPLWAVSIDEEQAAAYDTAAGPARWLNLRMVATDLDDVTAGVFTEALAMSNWHATHTHCPRCGASTTVESGGWVRRCTAEKVELFPRTDAAVIVGIVDHEERLLLGSNALWESNRFSLLAGFVEPGESLEAAAVREIAEESGVLIDDPQYVGSQPWPFPASLMVGFIARVASEQPAVLRPDGDEILELRWFTRDEIGDPHADVLLPGPSSIARAIIEHWYGGPLPERDRA